jgi:hypothetical protein
MRSGQRTEVLRGWRFDLIGWADAPRTLGFQSLQVATTLAGGDSPGRGLVPALFTVVPGRGATPCRA